MTSTCVTLVPPFTEHVVGEHIASLVISECGPGDIQDLMKALSLIPSENIMEISITSCLLDYESVTILTSLFMSVPSLETFLLRDIDWKYPKSLKEALVQVITADNPPSISERYFWYNSDSGEMPRMGRAHWDLFKCGQLLLTSLFYNCKQLQNVFITRCSLGCMWRPCNNQGYQDSGSSFFSILLQLVLKSKIERLAVEDCDLYDAHLYDVGSFWSSDSSLKELSLKGNLFTGSGLSHILTVDALHERPATPRCLRKLYLDSCLVLEQADAALDVLKASMEQNPEVKVALSNNRISDETIINHPQVLMNMSPETEEVQTPEPTECDSENIASDSAEASAVDELLGEADGTDSSSDDVSLVSEGSDIFKMYQESI